MSLNSATSTYGESEIHPVTGFWSDFNDLEQNHIARLHAGHATFPQTIQVNFYPTNAVVYNNRSHKNRSNYKKKWITHTKLLTFTTNSFDVFPIVHVTLYFTPFSSIHIKLQIHDPCLIRRKHKQLVLASNHAYIHPSIGKEAPVTIISIKANQNK